VEERPQGFFDDKDRRSTIEGVLGRGAWSARLWGAVQKRGRAKIKPAGKNIVPHTVGEKINKKTAKSWDEAST